LSTTFDAGTNRLGALALRLTDRLHAAVTAGHNRSVSRAAALSAMYAFLDAPSVDQLSQVLGLTSSATVRLVDGLVADGLAFRAPSADGRVSRVELTPSGRRRGRMIAEARADVLVDALAPLSRRERATFDALVDKILVELARAPSAVGWMCRLCDTHTCGAERGQPCPVTHAAGLVEPDATTTTSHPQRVTRSAGTSVARRVSRRAASDQ
jgi:DNA-binding MarR family transcriptional regulator